MHSSLIKISILKIKIESDALIKIIENCIKYILDILAVTNLDISLFMICTVCLATLIVLVAFLYYRLNVKPKKLKAYYVKQFRDKGFRVYEFPTNLLAYPALNILKSDSEKGDAFKTFKELYGSHDVIVGNSITSIEVTVTSP